MKFCPSTSTLVGGGGSLRHRGTQLGLSNSEENSNYKIERGEVTTETTSNGNLPLITIFLGSFAAVSVASLSYALVVSSSFPLELIGQDLGVGVIVTILAGIYLKLWTTLVKMGVLDPKDSRKIIHTGSVPLFILFWPFFSVAPWSRVFAATVPWINVFRLVAAAKSSNGGSEKDLALAVSRTGSSKEALEGPLIYCLITVLITLIFWRDSWIGIVALSTMAAGDGMADLVGRRLGKYSGSWPFTSGRKSYAGTIAFFLSSTIVSLLLGTWLSQFGLLPTLEWNSDTARTVALICFTCSIVEVIPFGDDNWTVPITASLLAYILL